MKLRIILSLLIIIVLISGCAKNEITASAIKDLPVEKKNRGRGKDYFCRGLHECGLRLKQQM